MNSQPTLISIVIPTLNEGDDVLATVDCILRHSKEHMLQLIVVDDGSTDHSVKMLETLADDGKIELLKTKQLGVARARNEGARLVRGDIVGFIDAHCYVPRYWLDPIFHAFDSDNSISALSPVIGATSDNRARGYGGSWLNEDLTWRWLPGSGHIDDVPFLCGCCTFIRTKVFIALGGFDEGFTRWGYEDTEMSIRLWLHGYRVVVIPNSIVFHKFRQQFPYAVDQVAILFNKLRMIHIHFDGERLRRLLQHNLRHYGAEEGMLLLVDSDSATRREQLKKSNTLSIDSFCDRFKLLC